MDGQRFGNLIRKLRARQGITTLELAARIEKSPSYVSKVETGGLRETPPPDLLDELARALETSVAELLASMGYPLDAPPTPRELPDELSPTDREAVLKYARYLAESQRSA